MNVLRKQEENLNFKTCSCVWSAEKRVYHLQSEGCCSLLFTDVLAYYLKAKGCVDM